MLEARHRERGFVISLVAATGDFVCGTLSENLSASRRWTADGIGFFYTTLERRGENDSVRGALPIAAVDDEVIYINLEAPASMWVDAYNGLVQFISAIHRG